MKRSTVGAIAPVEAFWAETDDFPLDSDVAPDIPFAAASGTPAARPETYYAIVHAWPVDAQAVRIETIGERCVWLLVARVATDETAGTVLGAVAVDPTAVDATVEIAASPAGVLPDSCSTIDGLH